MTAKRRNEMDKNRPLIVRAHLMLDDDCEVELTITGTPTEEAKRRLIRLVELSMERPAKKENSDDRDRS